jgi:hypothetical protein
VSSLQERAKQRRDKIHFNTVHLHSLQHNSFHTYLDVKEAWELLAKLSLEAWKEQTGSFPPNRVDKTICKFIKRA